MSAALPETTIREMREAAEARAPDTHVVVLLVAPYTVETESAVVQISFHDGLDPYAVAQMLAGWVPKLLNRIRPP